jgi:YHS domain-containing protein
MSTYVPKPITEKFLRMLMVDPVCGKDLRGTGALGYGPVTLNHNGVIYFFCSEGCRTRYEQDPEQFRRKH